MKFKIRNKKGQDFSNLVRYAIFGVIGLLVFGVILMLTGTLSNKMAQSNSITSIVVNETFTPGTDASGNAFVQLAYGDIINGSEKVQNNVAGNSSYIVTSTQYVLDAARGRINVTNLSAYNNNLNITYTRSVEGNATKAGARATNAISDLTPNIGTVLILGIILTVLFFVFQNWMGKKQ